MYSNQINYFPCPTYLDLGDACLFKRLECFPSLRFPNVTLALLDVCFFAMIKC